MWLKHLPSQMCCLQWPEKIAGCPKLKDQRTSTCQPFQHGIGMKSMKSMKSMKRKIEKAGMKKGDGRSVKKTVWGEICISQKSRHDGQDCASSVTSAWQWDKIRLCCRDVYVKEFHVIMRSTGLCDNVVCDLVVRWRRRRKRSRRRRTGAEAECVRTPQLMNLKNRNQRCLQWI